MGCGKQRGRTQYDLGVRSTQLSPDKVKLEVVVPKEESDAVIAGNHQAAATGEIGDGKIFLYEVAGAVRIFAQMNKAKPR